MSYPAGTWAPAPPYQPDPPDRPHSQSSFSASHGPPVPPASTRPRHIPEQPNPGPYAYAYEQPRPQQQHQWQPPPPPQSQPQPPAGPSQWGASPGYGSHSVESAMGDFGRMNLDGRSRDDEGYSRGYGQSMPVVSSRRSPRSGSVGLRCAARACADDASRSRILRIRNRARHRLSKVNPLTSTKAPLFQLAHLPTSLPASPVLPRHPRPLLRGPPASLR